MMTLATNPNARTMEYLVIAAIGTVLTTFACTLTYLFNRVKSSDSERHGFEVIVPTKLTHHDQLNPNERDHA